MSSMWFRCPICGIQWQGDPRFPPLCPNAAHHPRQPPGQLPQPLYYLPLQRPGLMQTIRARNRAKTRRGVKMTLALFGFMAVCLALGIVVRIILSILLPAPS